MKTDATYLSGARLYFDAKRMARDGLIIRDGCHMKVKHTLPLEPYLIWVSTWDKIGLASQISTPPIFADESDKQFELINHHNLFIEETNASVHDFD